MENKKKKRIVIALGGNALGNTLPEQMKAVKITAKAIVDLIEEGCEVIVAHGNGPQVGMINNAMAALSREDANQPNTPLSVCVAMSQAYIGYDLQNALREELYNRNIYDIPVATMITQVRVDADDPAFDAPSKPIGHFMTEEQAKIAEEAGACAVMALERIPADIRAAGGVSRMSDPKMIKGIQEAVSIPVMAKCRIGHFAEAQILEAIEIDYIDESEVLSPADNVYHIDKTKFDVPFVCGAKDLGEALRRINEGASMIRTKGEPGTGDVVQAVKHMRMMQSEIRRLVSMSTDELYEAAKQLQVPYNLVQYVHENGKLPVVNFAAGGVATPADAALMMQLGAEGVFVGSGIFKSGNPKKRANAIVKAVTNYNDAKMLAELSENLGEAMVGINEQEIEILMAERGK